MLTSKRYTGFTIVELLIVIVVIGILAAITIVAYNGVQNRANDVVVQTDLRNFAGKVMEYQAINGAYPNGGGTAQPVGMAVFPVSRGSYETSVHNFIYCANSTRDKFVVAAQSKSGKRFAYSSDSALGVYNQNWGGVIDVCANAGYSGGNFSYGYISSGTWYAWTQ